MGLAEEVAAAQELVEKNPQQAADKLRKIVLEAPGTDAETTKIKEQSISLLTEVYVKLQDAEALSGLLSQLRPYFASIPKAKTAKIVRNIVDSISKVPGSTQLQVDVCKEQAEWARSEKRTFLRQRIELRLASLYLDQQEYKPSLAIIGTLLSEVKKLDDKLLLVDIHLLESRVHHALRNLPKARAALTAARTAANAIYVPVALQAEIDTQSGILHAEEKDYKTGYSYFFEAFEQFSALGDGAALSSLKYMLLCKIMLNLPEDVQSLLTGKLTLKYSGGEVEAMRMVAAAAKKRSLADFTEAFGKFKEQLQMDRVVKSHFQSLYDGMLERNLSRIIEPYRRVQIAHVAKAINLPENTVEKKLSQMILDKKLNGILDQGEGILIVFEDVAVDLTYQTALETIQAMGKVVDSLYHKAKKLT